MAVGDKNVTVVSGASAAQQQLNAGRVDELEVDIAPGFFGKGLRFLDNLQTGKITLEQATEPATVRQILEHVGERTTAPLIAPARSPPLAMNGQQLAAPEWVFEAIPELEFDQTANLAAEAGHDQWTHPAGAAAEPIPELEFDQTLGL